jgi:uncharacterized protein involved in type VI secretion and phage assembly
MTNANAQIVIPSPVQHGDPYRYLSPSIGREKTPSERRSVQRDSPQMSFEMTFLLQETYDYTTPRSRLVTDKINNINNIKMTKLYDYDL